MRFNRILRCVNPIIESIVIKNNRHCIKCKYFDLSVNNCLKFKQQDYIMGDITDVSAEICRKDENKCGLNAVFYNEISAKEEEQRKNQLQIKDILNFTSFIVISCSIQGIFIIIFLR